MYVHSSRDFGAVGTDGASSERAVGKRPSAENSASNLCEKLGELSIHGRAVTLYIVSDDRPEMALAHRLWHQVYAKELANLHVPADRGEEDAIRLPLNGSRCILALSGGECVGTLRMSYAQS